jgi:hypothetical protein
MKVTDDELDDRGSIYSKVKSSSVSRHTHSHSGRSAKLNTCLYLLPPSQWYGGNALEVLGSNVGWGTGYPEAFHRSLRPSKKIWDITSIISVVFNLVFAYSRGYVKFKKRKNYFMINTE